MHVHFSSKLLTFSVCVNHSDGVTRSRFTKTLFGWRVLWRGKQSGFRMEYSRECGYGSIEFVRQRPRDYRWVGFRFRGPIERIRA